MNNMPQILLVDDDAALLQALPQALSLRVNNLQVDTCDSAVEALEQIPVHDYDAIVSDIKMPGMDGLALCEQIRNLPQHKLTPIVFVTSLTDFKTWARAILSGGNDVITKPILPVELCVKVITLLLKNHSVQ